MNIELKPCGKQITYNKCPILGPRIQVLNSPCTYITAVPRDQRVRNLDKTIKLWFKMFEMSKIAFYL